MNKVNIYMLKVIGAAICLMAPCVTFAAAVNKSSWDGYYAGLNGGYSINTQQSVDIYGTAWVQGVQDANHVPTTVKLRKSGFIGGAQLGYNFQHKLFLWGAELDFDGSSIDGSTLISSPAPSTVRYKTELNSKINWLSTLRAKIGVMPYRNFLIYMTAGLAVGKASQEANITQELGGIFYRINYISSSAVRKGYALGLGAEYKYFSHVGVRLEYLYFNLGNRTLQSIQTGTLGSKFSYVFYKFHNANNAIRLGVNYYFN